MPLTHHTEALCLPLLVENPGQASLCWSITTLGTEAVTTVMAGIKIILCLFVSILAIDPRTLAYMYICKAYARHESEPWSLHEKKKTGVVVSDYNYSAEEGGTGGFL